MKDRVDLEEFLAGYLAEVDEHLAAATGNLRSADEAARRGDLAPRAIRELFRSLHTIKGLSAMVGVDPVVDLAHVMETVLRNADRAAGKLEEGAIDRLAEGLRAIASRVRLVEARKQVPPAPQALIEELSTLGGADLALFEGGPPTFDLPPEIAARMTPAESAQLAQALQRGRRAVRIDFAPSPTRAARGTTITSVREGLAAVADIVKVVPVSRPVGSDAPGGLVFSLLVVTDRHDDALAAAAQAEVSDIHPISIPAATAPVAASALDAADDDLEAHRRSVVRVDVARLDDAMERLSALVVTRFRLARAVAAVAARGVDARELQEIVSESGRQLRDLRGAIVRARMVPVAELLQRVPLMVRGLRRATGKDVRVEIESHEAELDKAVAERIFPAIVHLVRNAVDHAIEPADERRRRGKSSEGLVRVRCVPRGAGHLELSIEDDGGGVDREAVARRAGRPVPQTDEDLLALLTLPGLSTREEANETSGRGMGLDIVKRVAVDLGGTFEMKTRRGEGTTFTLRVPLNLTIVDAFSFICGSQAFVVPVGAIEEIVEIEPARVTPSPSGPRAGRVSVALLDRRGEAVPLVPLHALLALKGVGGVAAADTPSMTKKALVVKRSGKPWAFEVERMVGQQEVVMRPLEDPLVRVTGVAGATDLGDGRPTLVLDLVALTGVVSA